ncbi:hypothetical protein Niako_2698 [Niastella koreensis GR20-10]|uniref:Uncharacterized protein n=2 Tax=Niastella koreensis TaxID=354356 RepID=G8T716_NIAKG|nr:hypothetical protein [Niastella koreensis]AEV99037.1 hypothetical protein Niako_2698 [Niastella koreensis GR20-10]
MQKGSIQKLSILGIVLMGASAVTAWVMPKEKPAFKASGALQNSVGAGGVQQQTCKAGLANSCDFTATDNVNSFTSDAENGAVTSDAGATTVATPGNTGLNTHNGDGFHVTRA